MWALWILAPAVAFLVTQNSIAAIIATCGASALIGAKFATWTARIAITLALTVISPVLTLGVVAVGCALFGPRF